MNIQTFPSVSALFTHFVKEIQSLAEAKEGPLVLGVSGGSSAKVFGALKEAGVDMKGWQMYLIDERYVPRDDASSNYHLLSHCLEGTGAQLWSFDPNFGIEESLRDYAHCLPDHFDLTVFGMGPDGHTASLFPGSPALDSENIVEYTTTEVFDVYDRLTLTYKGLERSQRNIVVAVGEEKRALLERLEGADYHEYPIVRVLEGGEVWVSDS